MVTRGLFITFEGMDGSGKTTQIQKLATWLESEGHEVVLTRNPGGTELGQSVRHLLLNTKDVTQEPVNDWAEVMLYMADRAQHTQQIVKPALEAGNIVLCDRHMDSTFAYQGYGRGLNLEMLRQLNDLACQGCLPDATILLDGPLDELLARVEGRGVPDRLESEAMAFKQRVQQGFLALANEQPERIKRFNAIQSAEILATEIQNLMQSYLPSPVKREG